MFAKTFGCCRKVYNLMLAEKIDGYEKTGKFPAVTPAKYKKDYPFLKEVDSLALANKQIDLQAAFRNTFSKSRKKKNGFPKFKSAKHSRKAYTTNNQNGTIAIVDDKYIKLPKVGKVKAIIHRIPNDNWRLKSATISQESDGKYYISLLFEFEKTANTYIANQANAIGLDYASDGLYVDSDGNRNKYFVKVDKWFPSSQICHCCGALHPKIKDLSIRTMRCDCALTISRDQNAAINIKNEGLRILKSA